MRITFSHSPDFDESIYSDEDLEAIVGILLRVQDIRLFSFLVELILDLNVYTGDVQSWLNDPLPNIKFYQSRPEVRRTIKLLVKLKSQFATRLGNYLSAIVPRYTLRKMENKFGVDGRNEVYVCIKRDQMQWDSSKRRGSRSVDAAIWDGQNGACYECKLDKPNKQGQIDLLCCIYRKSQRKMLVGLVSFASINALERHIAETRLNVPRGIIELLGRERLPTTPRLPY